MSPTRETAVHSQFVVEFVEQPANEFRFRYLSEFKKGSHGCLKSDSGKKRKEGGGPYIRTNYKEPMKLEICLYTATEPRREHVHKLVEGSKTDAAGGRINMIYPQVTDENIWVNYELKNLNILHKGKDEVDKFVRDWLLAEENMPQAVYDALPPRKKKIVEEKLKEKKREIENNVVLGVSIYDAHNPHKLLCGPCFSDKISNTKTVKKLNIEDISKVSGSCSGGDEVFILCDKIRLEDIDRNDPEKSDIAIEFYENGGGQWATTAKIKKIHHQTAIIFVTPPYKDVNLKEPLDVSMRLTRKSDGESSDSRGFTYEPVHDDYELRRKRKKTFHTSGNQQDEQYNINNNNNDTRSEQGPMIDPAAMQAAELLMDLAKSVTPGDSVDDDTDVNLRHIIDMLNLEMPLVSVEDVEREAPIEQLEGPEDVLVEQPEGLEPDALDEQPEYLELQALVEQSEDHSSVFITDNNPLIGGNLSDQFDGWQMDSDAQMKQVENSLACLSFVDDDDGKQPSTAAKKEKREERNSHPSTKKNQTTQTVDSTKWKELASSGKLLAFRLALQTAQCLHSYAKTGNVNILLMSMRHLIALQDEHGDNAIHASVLYSQVHVLESLLEVARTIAEYDVLNMCNGFNQSPLHIAVQKKHDKMVSLLLHYGANPNHVDRNGNMAIHLAAQQDTDACLQAILNTIKYTSMYKNHEPKLNSYNYAGFTPLHLAVQKNSYENVTRLCYAGCEVTLCDRTSGRSALHMAIENKNPKILSYILQNMQTDPNISPDIAMFNGYTPLHLAVKQNRLDLVRLLMEAKADPYWENKVVEVPLGQEADSSDSDNEGERRGLSPLDLAKSIEIRCCLKGEAYTPLPIHEEIKAGKKQEEVVTGATYKDPKRAAEPLDSGIGLSAMSCASSFSVDGRDQDEQKTLAELLDASAMNKLCEVLNVNMRWKAVLKEMDNSTLIDVIKYEKNPTEAMLRSLNADDGDNVAHCFDLVHIPTEAKRIFNQAYHLLEIKWKVIGVDNLEITNRDAVITRILAIKYPSNTKK